MNSFFRTDLAVELIEEEKGLPEGVTHISELGKGRFLVERITVSEKGSILIRKPQGKYFTVSCGNVAELDPRERDLLTDLLSELLKELVFGACHKKDKKSIGILVVGLGNEKMTPDAIGPKTISLVEMTRSLRETDRELFYKLGCCSVSGFTPGAMGQTGIETAELVSGAIKASGADVVIAIDALAACSAERLGASIQLSDSGIHPGSGVGNRRKGLNLENLGVPVISIGMPTVVDSNVLIRDFLIKNAADVDIKNVEDELGGRENYFVAPKDCDAIVEQASRVFAATVNKGFGIKIDR